MDYSAGYYPGHGFFHRLDPRVKIALMAILTIIVPLVRHVYIAVAMLLTVVVLWCISGLPLRIMGGYLKMLRGIIAFLFVVQAILHPGEVALIDPLIPPSVPLIGGKGSVTMEGLLFAALITVRLLALALAFFLVTVTTPIHLFTLGLVRLGLPYQLAYTITTAFNLVPTLQAEAKLIMDAQRLRAFSAFEQRNPLARMKAYPLLLTPLVIGAMRRAQLMAVAMESRGFGSEGERTYIEDIAMETKDWVFVGLTTLYCVAVLAVNF